MGQSHLFLSGEHFFARNRQSLFWKILNAFLRENIISYSICKTYITPGKKKIPDTTEHMGLAAT